jgi:hypothetical protein
VFLEQGLTLAPAIDDAGVSFMQVPVDYPGLGVVRDHVAFPALATQRQPRPPASSLLVLQAYPAAVAVFASVSKAPFFLPRRMPPAGFLRVASGFQRSLALDYAKPGIGRGQLAKAGMHLG